MQMKPTRPRAHTRQEGDKYGREEILTPTPQRHYLGFIDARLWPATAGAWAVAYLATVHPGQPTTTLVVAMLVAAGATCLAGAALGRGRNKHSPRHRRYPAGKARAALVIVAAVVAATGVSAMIQTHLWAASPLNQNCATTCELTVSVKSQSRSTGTKWRTRTQVENVPGMRASEVTLITARPLPNTWGEILKVKGTLVARASPPHLGTMRNPDIRPLPAGQNRAGQPQWACHLRHNWSQYLQLNAPPSAGLLLGMSVGDTALLPTAQRDHMRATSTSHLVAISGTHLALVVATVHLLIPGRGRTKAGIILAALLAMVILTGASASIIRASTMAALVTVAAQLGRRGQGLTTLAVVISTWLIIDPWLARSWGFALSSAATAGVLTALTAAPPRGQSSLVRRARRKVADLALIAFFAQAFTAPLVYQMVGTASIWAVPANLLAAPAVAVTTLGALAGMAAASYTPALVDLPVMVASAGGRWIETVTGNLAQLPGANLQGLAAGCAVALNLALAAALIYWRGRGGRERAR